MKLLHRPDLYAWSRFDEARNIDFNSYLWVRAAGNVVIDPLPLSAHERARLEQLGGVRHVVVTNSDHTRDARAMLEWSGATSYGPDAERATFPFACDVWVTDGRELVPGLVSLALRGSKTPGELSLLLEGTSLFTGDLVRAHSAAALDCLPDAKLADRRLAVASIRRLAALDGIRAVLPGDGWPVFRDGKLMLIELAERLEAA